MAAHLLVDIAHVRDPARYADYRARVSARVSRQPAASISSAAVPSTHMVLVEGVPEGEGVLQ